MPLLTSKFEFMPWVVPCARPLKFKFSYLAGVGAGELLSLPSESAHWNTNPIIKTSTPTIHHPALFFPRPADRSVMPPAPIANLGSYDARAPPAMRGAQTIIAPPFLAAVGVPPRFESTGLNASQLTATGQPLRPVLALPFLFSAWIFVRRASYTSAN